MVDAVNTVSPVTYAVHVDHLDRPIRMTDGSKAVVWNAVWNPWGSPHAISGAASLNARFPGQWFQIESGLHYNWHRHYDPSTGRYTQPDPLGFVDGPSVYHYAKSSPLNLVDFDGRCPTCIRVIVGGVGLGTLKLIDELLDKGGNLACVDWWEVAVATVEGAGLAAPHYWWSSRSAGGGVRLWQHGPGIDWHKFKLNGRDVNLPHYHRGSGRQIKKHRPYQGW